MEHPVLERPIPKEEWHEDLGPALWWKFPIVEPPYVGTPLDEDFSADLTHFTSIPYPMFSAIKETGRASSANPPRNNLSKAREPDHVKPRFDTLVEKHGTLKEFEKAVWNALGEISVTEAKEAIRKYQDDLIEAVRLDLADRGISVTIVAG